MPQLRKFLPLLKSTHFRGLRTRLTEQGLRFSYRISHEDRELEIYDTSSGDYEVEDLLEKLKNLRPFTNVTANPRRPSARSLLKAMSAAQRRLCPDEAISLTYGLSEKYMLQWERQPKATGEEGEGQRVVLVALDGDCPVGFAGLGFNLWRDTETKWIHIYYNLNLVYVAPNRRGEGFGIDLSIACGYLCREVLEAVYRAAPAGYTLFPVVTADLESTGGEKFTAHVSESLDFQVDMLRENRNQRSITVRDIEVDAGY